MQAIVVGPGKLGLTLMRMLLKSGAHVPIVATRSPSEFLPGTLPPETKLVALDVTAKGLEQTPEGRLFQEALTPGTLVLLTIPGSSLTAAAETLSSLSPWQDVLVVHCDGHKGASVLAPLRERGAITASIHPCYPLFDALPRLPKQVAYGFEGDERALATLAPLVTGWQGQLVRVQSESKALYHAANVLSAGHIMSLIAGSSQLLQQSGLDRAESAKVLTSLLSGFLMNAAEVLSSWAPGYGLKPQSLEQKITGPFVRGDRATAEDQIGAIRAISQPLADAYQCVGLLSEQLSKSGDGS